MPASFAGRACATGATRSATPSRSGTTARAGIGAVCARSRRRSRALHRDRFLHGSRTLSVGSRGETPSMRRLALLAVLVLLAGCGGDTDDDTASPGGETTPTGTTPAPTTATD